MGHEINQLDISGIQLRESRTQPKVSLSREIGEAKIVHTIFGRAKVRIIRKHDKFRRALWQTAIFIVAAAAAFIWQDWYAAQQTDSMRGGESALSVETGTQERASAPQLESVATPAIPPAVVEPVTSAPAENGKPGGGHGAPQSHAVMKAAEKEAAKPAAVQPKRVAVTPKPVAIQPKPAVPLQATVQPATAGTPQIPPSAAGENTLKTPAVVPPSKPALPKPPVAATAAMPASAKPVVPASGTAVAPVLTPPLAKDEAANHAPVADKQLAAPIILPGK